MFSPNFFGRWSKKKIVAFCRFFVYYDPEREKTRVQICVPEKSIFDPAVYF